MTNFLANSPAGSGSCDPGAGARAAVGFRPPDAAVPKGTSPEGTSSEGAFPEGALPEAFAPGWTPGAAVERLAGERATGALRGPAGTVYLVDGLVAHAESDRAPDLATLLTACGRLTRETWQDAVHRFGPHARVGEALVEQGRLTRGELELCHLGALYDAACFLLDTPQEGDGPYEEDGPGATDGPDAVDAPAAPARWTFAPGVRHWFGPVAAVGAHRLRREAERRQHLLDRIWPSAQFDTAPLRRSATPQTTTAAPGRHARRLRPPTRRQCELLDHADGRRTPAELARLLGRSAFATTADVRRLAAAGLLAGPDTGCAAGTAPAAPGGVPAPRAPGGLHRRVPGAALAALTGPPRAAAPPPAGVPPNDTDPDIALLIRVRTLLEARL
ncbi:transcriptional regulator [Kitasatospora sp. NPDC002551]|uniref:transcriptional regulator n=1 Tax=unclassified Kitasatospora TaxID=2633591 RepID=UPI00331E52D2